MLKSKTDVISIRIDDALGEKLHDEAELKNLNLNTLVNQILHRHVEWEDIIYKMGWISMSKRALKEFLATMDKRSLIQIAQTVGKTEFTNATKFAYGNFTFENAIALLERWIKNNYLKYSHNFEQNKSIYVIQHYLGKNWSVFFLESIDTAFQDLGHKLEGKSADENCCTFEITKI